MEEKQTRLCFRINVIINNKTGWIAEVVTIFPVAIINAKSIGRSELINPTRLLMVSLISTISSEKFVIINVTINMYCT